MNICKKKPPLSGQLLYIQKDSALDFVSNSSDQLKAYAGHGGVSSISFDTLTVMIGVETGVFLYPCGYFPETSWDKAALPKIEFDRGTIRVENPEEFMVGVSQPFDIENAWIRLYDAKSGWLFFGAACSKDDVNVKYLEFAEGVIAGFLREEICSLWMKPKIT